MKAGLGQIGCVFLLIVVAAVAADDVLPPVPEGAQAIALDGRVLYAAEAGAEALSKLDAARSDYDANPDDADKIIWLGRRLAYAGDYRGAIRAFSVGISKYPGDARMYRHRGHRYITIREFDRAIVDLEKAAELIRGAENEVEPDGQPNDLGISLSSLHGNIWYHLGLAYYLKQDWDNALRAYSIGFDISRNDDNRVSTTHWRYMILRRMGRAADAERVLDGISADMTIVENDSYHSLCLFYKGELSLGELLEGTADSPAGAAVRYGAANWHYVNGDVETARRMLTELTSTSSWAGFGYVAAEADLAAMD